MNILTGDCLSILPTLEEQSVQCVVTSPPYYGLRDYGMEGQIGLEDTPEAYVESLVAVFREVWRVLKDDGVLWLNLGDSYWANRSANGEAGGVGERSLAGSENKTRAGGKPHPVIKPKDLLGIPWMVAFALRADGWYLRSDIVWNKPNAMPESVTDRPTRAHEYIFLMAKQERYYYDAEAIKETATGYDGRKDTLLKGIPKYANGLVPNQSEQTFHAKGHERRQRRKNDDTNYGGNGSGFADHSGYSNLDNPYVRNKRDVWTVATHPYKGAHFAAFPPKLIEPCILAGSREGDTVLDPFAGSGTTGMVAIQHHRNFVGIELNPAYVELAKARTANVQQTLFPARA